MSCSYSRGPYAYDCYSTHAYPCGHTPEIFVQRLAHLRKQREKLVSEIKASLQVK